MSDEEKLLAKLARELKKVEIRYWSTFTDDSGLICFHLNLGNERSIRLAGYTLGIVSNRKVSSCSYYRTYDSDAVKRLYDHLEEQTMRKRPTALENSLDALLKLNS